MFSGARRAVPGLRVLAGTILLGALHGTPALGALGFECDPPTCDFTGSDTLDVFVTLDGSITDLAGFSLNLEVASTIVSAVSVIPGNLLETCSWAFYPSMSPDTVRVDAAGLGCAITGPGRLARVRLVGVNTGVSILRCRGSLLRDTSNAPLTHDCPLENLTYDSDVPVVPMTWGRIKRLYAL